MEVEEYTYVRLEREVDCYKLRTRRIRDDLVERYAEVFAGPVFAAAAPVTVYQTERGTYLVDGFHRATAFRRSRLWSIGKDEAPRSIRAQVRVGTWDEAREAAATANLDRPAQMDKRDLQAAARALTDLGWSRRRVATRLRVPYRTIQDWVNPDAVRIHTASERARRSSALLTRVMAQGDPQLVAEDLVQRDWDAGPLDAREYTRHLAEAAMWMRAVASALDAIGQRPDHPPAEGEPRPNSRTTSA